jgi:hypothetical protein
MIIGITGTLGAGKVPSWNTLPGGVYPLFRAGLHQPGDCPPRPSRQPRHPDRGRQRPAGRPVDPAASQRPCMTKLPPRAVMR